LSAGWLLAGLKFAGLGSGYLIAARRLARDREAMMFELFTEPARHVVVHAQEDARRLGHNYIGCEHLLLAAATNEPAGTVLRDHGVTPERIEAEILRTIGRARRPTRFGDLDREALASVGIDLDVVRGRIEAAFGPHALTRALQDAACRRRRPVWQKGPLAERTRRRRRARRHGRLPTGPRDNAQLLPSPDPRSHIPFTPRAKKSLQLSLPEAKALNDNYVGVQHLTLALLDLQDGMVPVILSLLGAPARIATRRRPRPLPQGELIRALPRCDCHDLSNGGPDPARTTISGPQRPGAPATGIPPLPCQRAFRRSPRTDPRSAPRATARCCLRRTHDMRRLPVSLEGFLVRVPLVQHELLRCRP
jgi:Clp amino terminal domain, pathogenicity island component